MHWHNVFPGLSVLINHVSVLLDSATGCSLLSIRPSGLPLAVSEVDRSLQLHYEHLIIHKGHFVTKTSYDGAMQRKDGQNNFGSKIGLVIICRVEIVRF